MFRVSCFGFTVSCFVSRVSCSGFRVSDSVFHIPGFGFKAGGGSDLEVLLRVPLLLRVNPLARASDVLWKGLGFRVGGVGLRVEG